MRIKNTLVQGKMNKDVDERLIPNDQYLHAENIRVVTPDGSNSGVAKSAFGNTKITSFSPSDEALLTDAICIGHVVDRYSDMIYYLLKTTVPPADSLYLIEYDTINNITSIVLKETRSILVRQFNIFLSTEYVDMKLLNDVENNKKFIFISDGINEPYYFDIEYAKTLGSLFTEDQILILRNPPLEAPELTEGTISTSEVNNLSDNFFIFSYRYKYKYDEYSALGPFSQPAFWAKDFSFGESGWELDSSTNNSMVNKYSDVDITFNTGSSEVIGIDIVSKEILSNNVHVVGSFNKSNEGWADNTDQTINFSNSKITRLLPESEIKRLFDNVPTSAYAQELISDRLVYGNYTEGFNMTRGIDNITPEFSLDYTSTAGTFDTAYTTMKSIVEYEVAIAYLDGKGRMTTPFTSGASVKVSNTDSDSQNKLRITISSLPPDFAKHYRIFVRESRTNYYTIITETVYVDTSPSSGVFVWVKINEEDINKISVGDFVFYRHQRPQGSMGAGSLLEEEKVKIAEISEQDANFLGGSEEAGLYFKFKKDSFGYNTTYVLIFETEGDILNEDIFYETNKTYNITETLGVAYHHGAAGVGDINQTGANDAVIVLHDLFNAYGWANVVESNRALDSFNRNYFRFDSRSSTPIDNYREITRIASLTYSGVYENTTGYNALNEFNLSTVNYKDLDTAYGSIQLLHSKDTDLYVFQEDKTHRILYTKDVLFDADGQGNVKESNKILGQEIAFAGEYGINKNPESFSFYGNRIYHLDKDRGALMRLGADGYTEISQNGLHNFFRVIAKDTTMTRFSGSYNPFEDTYLINLKDTGTDNTLAFSEKVKGFTSFYSFIPACMMYLNNILYSVKGGELYVHDDSSVNINTFYDVAYPSKLSVSVNGSPSENKVLKALSLEGSKSWDATIKSYQSDDTEFHQSTIDDTEFVEKEGMWYGYTRRNEFTNDTSSKAVYGIGEVESIVSNTITVTDGRSATIGDLIYKEDTTFIGTVVAVSATDITLSSVAGLIVTDYIYGRKNTRIEGSELRGYTFRVDLQDNDTTLKELYCINSEVFKSSR